MTARLAAAALTIAMPLLGAHGQTVQWVTGSGVHYFTTAVVHSTQPTPTGMIQRSTETVDLTGDLTGRLVYQPISEFDFAAGTLVNTGRQVFSGTILGSDPVLMYDDEFRFEVDLNAGTMSGSVYLTEMGGGPKRRCTLQVTGTGTTADGNATFSYAGQCRLGNTGMPVQ
ncbi:MAG TPA: hypothetical protein VFZ36_12380 [Vicinamibacterales bacterium]